MRFTALLALSLCGCLLAAAPTPRVAATMEAGFTFEGMWDVRTLLPGATAIPPTYRITVAHTTAQLAERSVGPVSRAAASAGERLGLVTARVRDEDDTLCRFPSSFVGGLNLTALVSPIDGLLTVDCNGDVLDGLSETTLGKWGAVYERSHALPAPLRMRDPATDMCTRLPWRLREITVQRPSVKRLIVVVRLLEQREMGEEERPCSAYFDLLLSEEEADTKGLSSYAGPIVMILIVLAVRTLPRYILERRGSIDATSFRGGKPPTLSAEKRAELLQRQRDIIAQMKREDGVSQS